MEQYKLHVQLTLGQPTPPYTATFRSFTSFVVTLPSTGADFVLDTTLLQVRKIRFVTVALPLKESAAGTCCYQH